MALTDETPELADLRAEYRMTLRVLAVVTERLLGVTGGERLEISDEALADTPDIVAWREEPLARVVITVAR